jgi:hypothetical protein
VQNVNIRAANTAVSDFKLHLRFLTRGLLHIENIHVAVTAREFNESLQLILRQPAPMKPGYSVMPPSK